MALLMVLRGLPAAAKGLLASLLTPMETMTSASQNFQASLTLHLTELEKEKILKYPKLNYSGLEHEETVV